VVFGSVVVGGCVGANVIGGNVGAGVGIGVGAGVMMGACVVVDDEDMRRKKRGRSKLKRMRGMQMHKQRFGRPVGTLRMPNSPAPIPTYL